MSGGTFNYIHNRHEFDEAMGIIHNEINDGEWQPETIERFREALYAIKKARIYLKRIDWLLAYDDSEESFNKRLNDELQKLNSRDS